LKAEALLEEDKRLSVSDKAVIKVLMLVVSAMMKRLGVNSKNSSKPGGQVGHQGRTLEKVETPV
jgi:hypothetical protein